MFGHRDAAAGHRRPRRRPARARRRLGRRLRHHPRRLELGLDLPAPRWPALDRPGHQLRDRHGPLARRDLPLQRLDVDLGHRLGAELALVHPPGVLQLRRLRHHDGRRDQPSALRPRRGRGRADRWLPHRVLLDALRDVLPRRVRQHVHRRRPWPPPCSSVAGRPRRSSRRSTTTCSAAAGGACCGSPPSCGSSCSSSSGCVAPCRACATTSSCASAGSSSSRSPWPGSSPSRSSAARSSASSVTAS